MRGVGRKSGNCATTFRFKRNRGVTLMKRGVIELLGIVFVGAVWTVGVLHQTVSLFEPQRGPIGDLFGIGAVGGDSAVWTMEVGKYSQFCFGAGMAGAVLWYVFASIRKVHSWQQVECRLHWGVGLMSVFLVVVWASLTGTDSTTSVKWGVYLLYAFQGGGVYYISTVFFSPNRWKYAAPLARYLRVW